MRHLLGKPRRATRIVLIALVAAVILSGLAAGGCTGGRGGSTHVSVEPDPRTFTLFVGLLGAGYASDADTPLNPTQQSVLDALADLGPAERDSWKALLADSGDGSAPPEFALTDQVLGGGPPPDFTGLGSAALQSNLQSLWVSHAKTLYEKTLEAQTQMGAALTSTAEDTVKQALAYARVETSPFGSLQVIPNPLAATGFSRSRLDPETRMASVVLGPGDGDLTRALAREVFRLCLDQSLFQSLEPAGGLAHPLTPVFEASRAWPFSQGRCGTLTDFARENLARACVLRAFPPSPEDTASTLAEDWDAGFTLVKDLCDGLADYESTDQSLSQRGGAVLSGLPIGSITDRMVAQPPTHPRPPEGYPALPEGWEWKLTSSGKKYVAFGKIGTPRAPCVGTVRSLWSNNGAGFLLEDWEGDPVVAITIPGSNEASLGIRSVDVEKGEVLPWITDRSACIEFGFKLDDANAVAFAREVVHWLLGDE